MGKVIQVWPEEPASSGGIVEAGASVELPSGRRWRLWYRLPATVEEALAPDCDAYAVALLPLAMAAGSDLRVRGQVSPSLLRNLEEFQAVWHAWRPERYRLVDVLPEAEAESDRRLDAVAAFSGGVDSAYTIHRHAKGRAGRRTVRLSDGLFVHGFDLRLEQAQEFENAARRAEKMLASLGLGLVPMATNLRELKLDWEETHGSALASCMTLLKGRYGTGVIGPTWPYDRPKIPWGSNPLTDPLLGSDSFAVVHDDASVSRLGRIRELCDWPEALGHLRVCWEAKLGDRNCCVCNKCVRTILAFLALGKERPGAFPTVPGRREILSTSAAGPEYLPLLAEILATARTNGLQDTEWCRALTEVVDRDGRRALLGDARKLVRRLLLPRKRV